MIDTLKEARNVMKDTEKYLSTSLLIVDATSPHFHRNEKNISIM